MQEIKRDEIINAVHHALEPLLFVIAMWEGGSAAWGREDAWSDIDLQLVVEDDFVPETIVTVEQTLRDLSPIDIRYEVPQPTWHGHAQIFYRLRDTSEYLMVDLAVMRRSSSNQFKARARHGVSRIFFDKTGDAQPTFLDRAAHNKRLAERLGQLSLTFPLFQCLIKKEVLRGNVAGAASRYYSNALQPLLTLLRIHYCPDRFDFGPAYTVVDLPPEIVRHLEPLWFVSDMADIEAKRAQIEAFFFEVLADVQGAP